MKLYVGSSVSINERISNHKKTLENNRHRNPHLQRSYNKYGKEMFIYFTVELCSSEDLEIKEDEWMTKWDTINNGFNSQPATNKSGINLV